MGPVLYNMFSYDHNPSYASIPAYGYSLRLSDNPAFGDSWADRAL
jgi:hypothetical protein